MMISTQMNAPVIYAGDPDWHSVTVGLCRELYDWVDKEAKRRKISRSEMMRLIVIEAYRSYGK